MAAMVYALYVKQNEKETYITELAVEQSFIEKSALADIASIDGCEYGMDPEGHITLVTPQKEFTLILKPLGVYG